MASVRELHAKVCAELNQMKKEWNQRKKIFSSDNFFADTITIISEKYKPDIYQKILTLKLPYS